MSPQQKKSNEKLLTWIGIALGVLIAGAILYYRLFGSLLETIGIVCGGGILVALAIALTQRSGSK